MLISLAAALFDYFLPPWQLTANWFRTQVSLSEDALVCPRWETWMSSNPVGLVARCSGSFDFNKSLAGAEYKSGTVTRFHCLYPAVHQKVSVLRSPHQMTLRSSALMSLVAYRRPVSPTRRSCTHVRTFLCDSKPVSCELITQL